MVDRLAQTVSVMVKYASPEEVELFKTLEPARISTLHTKHV